MPAATMAYQMAMKLETAQLAKTTSCMGWCVFVMARGPLDHPTWYLVHHTLGCHNPLPLPILSHWHKAHNLAPLPTPYGR